MFWYSYAYSNRSKYVSGSCKKKSSSSMIISPLRLVSILCFIYLVIGLTWNMVTNMPAVNMYYINERLFIQNRPLEPLPFNFSESIMKLTDDFSDNFLEMHSKHLAPNLLKNTETTYDLNSIYTIPFHFFSLSSFPIKQCLLHVTMIWLVETTIKFIENIVVLQMVVVRHYNAHRPKKYIEWSFSNRLLLQSKINFCSTSSGSMISDWTVA